MHNRGSVELDITSKGACCLFGVVVLNSLYMVIQLLLEKIRIFLISMA